MSWLTDTVAGRTIMVLVIGLGTITALAHYLYQSSIEREVTSHNIESLVERLVFLTTSITSVPDDKRDDAAHKLSGGPLELHWAPEPLTAAGGKLDDLDLRFRARLIARLGPSSGRQVVMGTSRAGDVAHGASSSEEHVHTTLVSLPLSDGSWLNVTLARGRSPHAAAPSILVTILFAAGGIVLTAVLMSYWLTQPLTRLAAGARKLFLTADRIVMPETGTREVRTLATAFNDLQERIRRLIDDRTQMLAAISHDLRTPLTRLRLRIARIEDPAIRKSVAADLNEMESMIDATLAFLRDDTSDEPLEPIDLAAIIETIATDAADSGHEVSVQIPRSIIVNGRHLALKRAMTNVVQNAIKYGRTAHITAQEDVDDVVVLVDDDGPGIADDKLELVFEPFRRVEESRGRETGGYGLGLTVARSIVRAHGGDITLSNRAMGGLKARIVLPRS
jgi:two-component system, OmpR family, sensor kinase